MLCFPNCKINIGLFVTRRRDDGYHDLETLFYPVNFCDTLEVVPATQSVLHLSGVKLGGDTRDNLVWQALLLLRERFPKQIPELAIYLHKVIPMGAGLGGGSADGAFMLRLLNDYGNLGLTKPEMAELALQLGSDCPFFIYNTPQMAAGRGEKMEDISLDLSAYSIQLICPKIHVSTKDAFSMIVPNPAPFDLRDISKLPPEQWRDIIKNDFETTVFARHAALPMIKEQLYAQGAVYASMSGSGSAIYGIFPKGKRAVIDTLVHCKEVFIN